MKRTDRLIALIIFFSLSAAGLCAQERVSVPEGYVLADSIVYRPAAAVDTTLAGKDIFRIMPVKSPDGKGGVKVMQTRDVEDAMRRHVAENSERTLTGYRVRIFFDNRQTARVESEETMKRFERLYHDVTAYRTYANPYFKVTVGDFRTRSEAMNLLERIRHEFPSAFVVKENIVFPVVDEDNAYVIDTVKVMRPVKAY